MNTKFIKNSSEIMAKNLLLVDDDPNLILLVKDFLEFKGYTVLTANNGLEALSVIKDNSVDMIICDIMMPEMDGYALVQEIKQDSEYNSIPVMFLSAKGQTQDRVKGLNIGAEIYMAKPFEPEELLAQVESTLKQTDRLIDLTKKNNNDDNLSKIILTHSVKLTFTEKRVVNLVAQGMGNREIAKILKVSQRTIESHVSNMLNKTGLHNRTELARWSLDNFIK